MTQTIGTSSDGGPRRVLKFLKQPLFAATIVSGIDAIVLVALLEGDWKTALVLVLLLEGGVGLLAGSGIALSSTPSVSKVGETMLGTAPWSREAEKHGERVGLKWMVGASVLIAVGFGLSVI